MNINSNTTNSTSSVSSSSYTREVRLRWAQQMNEHYIIYMSTTPYIFRVPKTISDTNPDAYVPRRIGLGAYHHFRPDLGRKGDAAQEFLSKEKFKELKIHIVDEVIKGMEPSIRSAYDEYLDVDTDTLGWIMAIDSVYLLHLLSKYPGKVSNNQIEGNDRELAKDILLLENQLPFQLLKEIRKAAKSTTVQDKAENQEKKKDTKEDEEEEAGEEAEDDESEDEGDDQEEDDDDDEDEEEDEEEEEEDEKTKEEKSNKELFEEMLALCKAHSPLDLSEDSELVYDAETLHLLSYLYRLIRYNWQTPQEKADESDDATFRSLGDDDDDITENVIQTARLVGDLTGQKHFLLLAKLPLKQFFALFKKDNNSSSSIQEINIPSASQLYYVSKVDFGVCQANASGGIGINYVEEEGQRKLFLPVIRLNTDSEVILRNLVAYEIQRLASLNYGKNNAVISGFVDFVCGLIDTVKDVELLKEKGVIVSDLPNPVIVKIFNGISKSDLMREDLAEATEKLNLVYDNSFRVKAWKFITDHFVPSQASVRAFFAILIVFLLSLQAFCQIYGCSAHWFRKTMLMSISDISFIGHSDT